MKQQPEFSNWFLAHIITEKIYKVWKMKKHSIFGNHIFHQKYQKKKEEERDAMIQTTSQN